MIKRAIAGLSLALALYLYDEAARVVFLSLLVGAVISIGSYYVFRLSMPGINLFDYAMKAGQEPLGAAIVLLAAVVWACSIAWVSVFAVMR
jgi:hypothetical protein